jgi:hypothetical protein
MKLSTAMAFLALTLGVASEASAQDYDDDDGNDLSEQTASPDFAADAYGAQDVNLAVFEDTLSPYGAWIDTPDYGRVWRPAGMSAGWRPYSQGRWVWTAYGWTWVGNEPWAWAPYHYGRWVQVADVGWSWMPDYTWGPAWVSFRFGPSYVGWAPLPPGSSYSDAWYDSGDPDYSAWCFTGYGAFYPGPEVAQFNVYPSLYSSAYVRESIWANTRPAPVVSVDGASIYGPTASYVSMRVGTPVVPVAIHASPSVVAGRLGFDGRAVHLVAPSFHGVAHPFGGGAGLVAPGHVIGVGSLLAARAVPHVMRGAGSFSRPQAGITGPAPHRGDAFATRFGRPTRFADLPGSPNTPRSWGDLTLGARAQPPQETPRHFGAVERPSPGFRGPQFGAPLSLQREPVRNFEAVPPSAPRSMVHAQLPPVPRFTQQPQTRYLSSPVSPRVEQQRVPQAPRYQARPATPRFEAPRPASRPAFAPVLRGNVFRHR